MKKQIRCRFIYSSNYSDWTNINWIDLSNPKWDNEAIDEELKQFEISQGLQHGTSWSGFEWEIYDKPNILLGMTGSVATILSQSLINELNKIGDIKTILTEKAQHFHVPLSPLTYRALNIYLDKEEWDWEKKGDPILHIELRKWADVFIIAPLSANSLAKIANGICDNLLTCVVRAWDWEKPLLVAPSMNTNMLNHPITAEHIEKIKSWGVNIIPSQVKLLACGDTGDGAMASIENIIKQVGELWK